MKNITPELIEKAKAAQSAEEDALRAIARCIKNGFRVMAQTNVHRRNVDSMVATARLLVARRAPCFTPH